MTVTLQPISPHVYWLPPAPPDRPSLCAVVGTEHVLWLDAGASDAHARAFMDALTAVGVPAPSWVMLTHWHWDHVFGAAVVGAPVIAHTRTAARLKAMASVAWDDAALDARVAAGLETVFCADNIKLELPAPRAVRVRLPTLTFDDGLTLHLGGVTVQLQHVGGDHADDSVVAYVVEDRHLFLGDCLYDAVYAPVRHYTAARLLPLVNTLCAYDIATLVEGHGDTLYTPAEFSTLTDGMRLAVALVNTFGTDEAAVLAAAEAQTGQPASEDLRDFVRALIAGLPFAAHAQPEQDA